MAHFASVALTNVHHGPSDLPAAQPWTRQLRETNKSWEAFEIYRAMGTSRSLAKVAQALGKSTPLMERWSRRHDWLARVGAWDAFEAATINAEVLRGTAAMRRRLATRGLELQEKAAARISRMTERDIDGLSPVEAACLLVKGAELEGKARADIDANAAGFLLDLAPPTFVIQVISPGRDMVGVILPSGERGYIKASEVERFRHDWPDAVVLA